MTDTDGKSYRSGLYRDNKGCVVRCIGLTFDGEPIWIDLEYHNWFSGTGGREYKFMKEVK